MRFIKIEEEYGDYFVDMEKRISVFVDRSGLDIYSIGHLVKDWLPLAVKYVDIEEADYNEAYDKVLKILKIK